MSGVRLVELFFRLEAGREPYGAEDALHGFLAALRMNGQVLGRELAVARVEGGYLACLLAPAADSLDLAHANSPVGERWQKLAEAGLAAPLSRLLGPDPGGEAECRCEPSPWLILYTTYLSISVSTGRPVYYYLYRHAGASERAERVRRCPSCGGDWLLAAPLHAIFDFRCDRCRLLSNVAFQIGE